MTATLIEREFVERRDGYHLVREKSLVEFDTEIISNPDNDADLEDFAEAMDGRQIVECLSAYTYSGDYIGNEKMAEFLCGKGIRPEKIDSDHHGCSVGFCEAEQKWYGWSHRALYGFGIGDSVKPGDCAYMPTDKEDFRLDCIRFWASENHINVHAFEDHDGEDGPVVGVRTEWEYAETTPNEKIRGTISGCFTPYPDEFGRGEWTAKTLEDARQMACDFAEGVS